MVGLAPDGGGDGAGESVGEPQEGLLPGSGVTIVELGKGKVLALLRGDEVAIADVVVLLARLDEELDNAELSQVGEQGGQEGGPGTLLLSSRYLAADIAEKMERLLGCNAEHRAPDLRPLLGPVEGAAWGNPADGPPG